MSFLKSYRDHVENLRRSFSEVLSRQGLRHVVIHAGYGQKQSIFDDQYWPFKPAPWFAYWTPLVESGASIRVSDDGILQLYRNHEESFWEGPGVIVDEGVFEPFDVVHGDCPAAGEGDAFIGANVSDGQALGFSVEAVNPEELVLELESLRLRKSVYEIACIEEATAQAVRGHCHLADLFAQGASSELELHLAYLEDTRQDSWQAPYGNIVAIGEHAAVLHHVHYDVESRDRHSLLVDAGVSRRGYACDITRTWARGDSGGVTTFRELIDGIDALQRNLCDSISPGDDFEALHNRSHELLAELLLKIDVVHCSAEEAVVSGATRKFFPHGLGHSLGIQVHDVGGRPRPPRADNPFLRTTLSLEQGYVVTVEPGCYFIPALLAELRDLPVGDRVNWPLVDTLRPFGGVRIEDNVLVTASGSRNLTRDNWPASP